MEWVCGIMAPLMVAGLIAAFVGHKQQLRALYGRIEQKKQELSTKVQQWFMVQPCFRCQEFTMELLEISPNGRSVHYQCRHCKKKSHAPAGVPDAPSITELWNELYGLVERYSRKTWFDHEKRFQRDKKSGRVVVEVVFDAPAAPLPYEQTSRTPIPEAVRTEVWRRDGGRCVQCGSKQNLQFDHIIPVAQGGATSVANLQLLCQPCNGAKGKKI
jgi:hypothetical protein